MPENGDHKKRCRHCREDIDQSASVCRHCNRVQSTWRWWVVCLPTIAIPLVMVIIAVVQLKLAFKEKEDATNSARQAKNSLDETRRLGKVIEQRAKEVRDFQSSLLSGEETMYFVFLRDGKEELLPVTNALTRIGSSHGGAYDKLRWLLHGINKIQDTDITQLRENADAFYFSLLETTVMSWLCKRYSLHWILTNERELRIGTSKKWWDSPQTQLYPNSTVWSRRDIQFAFQDNVLFEHISEQHLWKMTLPPDTKCFVTPRTNKMNRVISFSSPQVAVRISLRQLHTHGLREDSKKLLQIDNHFGLGQQCVVQPIEIKFSYEFVSKESLSDLSRRQHRWIKGMIKHFREDFQWDLVERDLKTLQRN